MTEVRSSITGALLGCVPGDLPHSAQAGSWWKVRLTSAADASIAKHIWLEIDVFSHSAWTTSKCLTSVGHSLQTLQKIIGWVDAPTETGAAAAPPPPEPVDTVALVIECRNALAEELAALDLEPLIHHVQRAHDKCVAWLDAHQSSPGASL